MKSIILLTFVCACSGEAVEMARTNDVGGGSNTASASHGYAGGPSADASDGGRPIHYQADCVSAELSATGHDAGQHGNLYPYKCMCGTGIDPIPVIRCFGGSTRLSGTAEEQCDGISLQRVLANECKAYASCVCTVDQSVAAVCKEVPGLTPPACP